MTAATAPQAPGAIALQGNISPPELLLEPIFYGAFRNLYPRLALFEALAKFQGGHRRREQSTDDICEARRNFLDSFAYLCDVEKGGACVTAAGLQKLPLSNILWLAVNERIRPDVETYAETILQKLNVVEPENQKLVQDEIFRLVVEKCYPRITVYKGEMQKHARNCRMQLRQELRDEIVTKLRSKLKRLSEPPPSMTTADLIDLCYNTRGADVDEIRSRSKEVGDDFDRLAHYIGRLGATRSSTDTVVRAMIKVPALRNIFVIRTVTALEPREVSVDPVYMSPYEIVWAICNDNTARNAVQIQHALHAIVDLDITLHDQIRSGLLSRKSIITRVHAELQIADKFSRDRYIFVDDDKYIGCSKPACYFCHSWLRSHKHGYVLPATHCKIIVGCRGPDIGINEAGAIFLKEMYTKVCGKLDQDILEYLLKSQHELAHHRHHFLSTEGSSRAPSQV